MLASQLQPDSVYLHFEEITTKNGLSQGMVRCIYQDKEGFIWFATKDGLNKYDGYTFTTYRHSTDDPYSLPENYISQMIEDDNGNFWLGTVTKRLWIFDKEFERFYPVEYPKEARLPFRNEVRKLEINKGHLLVTMLMDVMMYDIRSITKNTYRTSGKVLLRPVFDYREQGNNPAYLTTHSFSLTSAWMPNLEIWVSYSDTIHKCIPNATKSEWKCVALPITNIGLMNDPSKAIKIVPVKNSAKIIMQTSLQLGCFNTTTNSFDFLIGSESKGELPTQPVEVNNGNFRIRFRNGFYLFNPTTFTLTKIINGRDYQLSSLTKLTDRDGVIWTGSNGYGAVKYDPRKEAFTVQKSKLSLVINTTGDRAQVLGPFASKDEIPEQLVRANIIPADYAPYFKDRTILIKKDHEGIYWLLRPGNQQKNQTVCSYNPFLRKAVEYKTFAKNLEVNLFCSSDDKLICISSDKMGDVSVSIIDCRTSTTICTTSIPTQINFYEYPFVSQVLDDGKGMYWFATLEGLFRFDSRTKQWKHWKNMPGDNTSISTNMIFSICFDPQNPEQYLWVGTNGGGLNKFDISTGRCVRFTEREGLPNNVIYGILSDSNGNIWCSTNRGICSFNSREVSSIPMSLQRSLLYFTDDNGLGDFEFNRYEFAKTETGKLAFGGILNVTVFDPVTVLQAKHASPLKFTKLSIFNTPVSFKERPDIVQSSINYTQSITLHYHEAYFAIDFALLDYSDPKQKLYQYYVEGLNQSWINNGDKNSVTFAGLNPGRYVLHVRGRNAGGVWSVSDIVLTIVIIPPWWQTWWFYLLASIAILFAFYAIYRYRLAQAVSMFELRNRIARDLHDEVGSTLSSISLSVAILQRQKSILPPAVQSLLHQISEQAQTTMDAMSDIVWTINSKNDRADNVIDRMYAFAVEVLEPQNVTLEFKIDDLVRKCKLDMSKRKNLYLFFKESVNNIAKHAKCTNAEFAIQSPTSNVIIVRIKDNGVGIPASILGGGKIANTHGGNGITNLRNRAEELKGTLEIITEVNQGTEITLKFYV